MFLSPNKNPKPCPAGLFLCPKHTKNRSPAPQGFLFARRPVGTAGKEAERLHVGAENAPAKTNAEKQAKKAQGTPRGIPPRGVPCLVFRAPRRAGRGARGAFCRANDARL